MHLNLCRQILIDKFQIAASGSPAKYSINLRSLTSGKYVDLKVLEHRKHPMIWLVDDDTEDLDIFMDSLQRNGYVGETRLVADGSAVMDLLSGTPRELLPSIIVMDLNMHAKSGLEILRELKADARLQGIPVIILSGSANKEDEVNCLALGCDRYWKKPSSIQEYDVMVRYLTTLF